MKVAITSIVALNPGDAAILQGTIRILESMHDDLAVVVLDRAGGIAERYYPWAEFLPALFRAGPRRGLRGLAARRGYAHRVDQIDGARFKGAARLLRSAGSPAARLLVTRSERTTLEAYRDADLVIASGGTYLVGHYNLQPPVLEYEAALALGRPLIMFPQSMGPFGSNRWTARLSDVLASTSAIFVRDSLSAEHLAGIGIRENVSVVPDTAFALAPAQWPAEVVERGRTAPRRIAISVREWRHFSGDSSTQHAAYISAVARLTESLVNDHGAEVTFLSTCQGISEYWTDDSATALQITDGLSADTKRSVTVDRAFRQPVELVDVYRTFDAVVATRMHAGILALCAGTPVLPIAYEFKTRELFRGMGLGEWVVDIEEPDRIADIAAEFLGLITQIGSTQRAAVLDLRRRVYRIADVLAGLHQPA